MMKPMRFLGLWLLATALALGGIARAQAAEPPPLSSQEIDALVAPIALYPDGLLSQVLMASTYPLEVVSAARWSKAHPEAKGDAALKLVENEPWDVSVKSLVAFPNVLEMMNEKLDWTQKLGDAFLGQQKDVLDSVQRMRKLAKDNGNLESNPQQVVKTEAQTIIIEPAQPQTIYVPAYNPTVVYGAWPYPAYPPYYYPGVAYWYPGQALVRGFAWGVGFAAAGAIFGSCNWGRGDVNINVNRATNIDRNYTRNNVNTGDRWQHNAQHRGNAPYRDQASREKFGNKQADRARDDFRGRESGERGERGDRDGIGGGDRGERGDRGSAGDRGDRGGMGDRGDRGGRDSVGTGERGGAGDRAGAGDRGGRDGVGSADRSGNRGSGFEGINSGSRDMDRGRQSTAAANRGGSAGLSAGGGGHSFGGGGSSGGRSMSAGGGGRSMGGGGGGRGGGRGGRR